MGSLLLWLVAASLSASIVAADIVKVQTLCKGDGNVSCVDINVALSNLSDDTELHLLEGHHYLTNTADVSSLSNISIFGMGNTLIGCANYSGFIFRKVWNLTIANIDITSCGVSGQSLDVIQRLQNLELIVNKTHFYSLLIINCRAVTLKDTAIYGSKGLGLVVFNAMESLTLSDITLSENQGGGAFLLYSDSILNQSNVQVHVTNCTFIHNYVGNNPPINAYPNEPMTSAGGGITIIMASTTFVVDFYIEASVFDSNAAQYGGGVHLGILAGVHDSSVHFSNCIFTGCSSALGGALYIVLGVVQSHCVELRNVAISVSNSSITENRAVDGGGLYQLLLQSTNSAFIRIKSSLFEANVATLASAIAAYYTFPLPQLNILFSLEDSTVKNNLCELCDSKSAAALIISHGRILLKEDYFLSNEGSGLICSSCSIDIVGDGVFYNNTGVNGGAMQLVDGYLRLHNNSHLSLHDNTARLVGGGVYVEASPDSGDVDKCFLEIDSSFSNCSFLFYFHALIDFHGNYAPVSSMIHGSSLRTCSWMGDTDKTLYQWLYSVCNNSELMRFDDEPTGVSKVSSPSTELRVSGNPSMIVPGEVVCVFVTAYDIFNQTIQDIVTISQGVRITTVVLVGRDSDCIPVVISGIQNSSVNVEIRSMVSQARLVVSYQLTECPLGYLYNESTQGCQCLNFCKTGIQCMPHQLLHVTPSNVWLGKGRDEFENVLVWGHCPRGYCKTGPKNIIKQNFSSQCSLGSNRIGLLCGLCESGFSATLGTTKDCRKCSNASLLMLVILLSLGVVIIAVLAFFRVSLAEGYFNSIIFYSNIISVYGSHFVPKTEWHVLFIVADLLSLNLNFNTCLYDGMTQFVAVIFQYAFVAYFVLLIVGVVYLMASRCFPTGSDTHAPSKTMVTLLVLCYMSLIDVSIKSLSFARVYTLSGDLAMVVWREDTSLNFFTSIHGILVVLTVIVFLFLLLPFTIIFQPRCSYRMPCLARLKPLYDAAWAPFKPEARWWFGFRLILRCILSILAAALDVYQGVFVLGLVLAVLLLIQSMLKPFRAESVNFLDNSLLVLVLSLALCSLHERDTTLLVYSIVIGLLFYSILFLVFVVHCRNQSPHFLSVMQKLYFGIRRKCCLPKPQHALLEREGRVEHTTTEVNLAGLRDGPDLTETEIVTSTGHTAINVVTITQQGEGTALPQSEAPEVEVHEALVDTQFYTCRDDSHTHEQEQSG
jgi:hypothetical protein